MTKKRFLTTLVLFLAVSFIGVTNTAQAGHHMKPVKKGILLVAFGSSMPEAQVSFDNMDKAVKAAFPGVPVRWAYTSRIIRHKIAKEGKYVDSTAVALARMLDDNFTHVAVQSLHTIPGEEYDDLINIVNAFKAINGGFEKVIVGRPLLGSMEDMNDVVDAVIANIPKERKKKEAVVFMGHGTPHASNTAYAAMMFHLQRKDLNIFVGTVEGSPTIDDIKAMLKEKGIKKTYLIPFMSVAGDHARNDMAGDEEDSWKSILTQAGIECVPVLKGTAEYANMVNLWTAHLKQAFAHFK
ncbi:MAG: sirohydrochlorin cobaltochelatase [Deltaproteobacteria bacterium]|nr:sirohydrochlorin cobaltochelatase [Deltaproteobacteria bacterium]